jgi:hypothetical protein
MSETRADTDAEFERMLGSREFATIHDVAAVTDLRDLLGKVQGALDQANTAEATEPLPTRR